MAHKHLSGANTIPRLVVKIVGSKQVKQFIEEPQEGSWKKEESPPGEAADEGLKKPAENQDVTASRRLQDRADSAVWAVINKVPDRLCVTAPSGDRSRSYVHPKTHHSSDSRAATEQEGVSEDRDKAELSSAVTEQLSDWQLSSLGLLEDEAAALDLTFSGKLHRSEITHLFLKHDVPLKLPTFSLLLHLFSDENDPAQVHYRNLLQFLRSSALAEELDSNVELQCG